MIRDNATLGFGFVNVNVNVVVAPTATVDGANALVRTGGWFATTTVAVAGAPVPPLVEVTGLVVLTFVPRVVP